MRIHLHSDVELFVPLKVRAEGSGLEPAAVEEEGRRRGRRSKTLSVSAFPSSHSLGREGTEDKGVNGVPPQDPDAEMSVIGAVLLDNDVIRRRERAEGRLRQSAKPDAVDVIPKQFRSGEKVDVITPPRPRGEGSWTGSGKPKFASPSFQSIPRRARGDHAKLVREARSGGS